MNQDLTTRRQQTTHLIPTHSTRELYRPIASHAVARYGTLANQEQPLKTLTITAIALLVACIPAPLTLAPCATEDQETACYWDAANRGNGLGQTFIVHNTK